MTEEAIWQKWEGPGEPPGKGGQTTAEFSKSKDVEGRGKVGFAVCSSCGVVFYSVPEDWRWLTCWNCGALNYKSR